MWPNPQFPADTITFTKGILNGKVHFCPMVGYKDPGLSLVNQP